MSYSRRIAPLLSSARLHVIVPALLFVSPTLAQTVNVNASMSNQTLEGWGTSLAWFANGVGG